MTSVKALFAILFVLFGVGFALAPDAWIEARFGFSPDGGDGWVEALVAAAPIALGLCLGWLAYRDARRGKVRRPA
jgi:hypothetical protein